MAVRRESVRLDVEGNFARGVLEDAAAVEVLKRSLKDLSGQSVQSSRATKDLERDIDKTGRTAERSSRSIGLLAGSIGSLFPLVAPLGGVGLAGLAGIANDAGMATVALGSLVVAFHGVGSTLQAVNKAALDPTAANLSAAQLAMEKLTPAARQFVAELHGMGPIVHQLQASAASGWFPGLTQALHNLIPLAPVIDKIFHDVGTMGGKLAAQGAKALAGPQWASFFKFIDTEAPKAMAAIGHVLGSVAHGLAQLWMAFAPLNHSFNNWIVDVAKSFDKWATGLSATQGFHDFLDYIHQTGPQVAAAVGAIANAVVQIVQAAAPLGGQTLQILTAIAKVLGAIAASPLGTPILALIQMATLARLASAAIAGLGTAFEWMGLKAVVAGAEGKAAAGPGGKGGMGIGPAAVIALLGGTLANQGYDAAGSALSPGQSDLGSANNITAVIDSIHKSTGFKGLLGGFLADPAKIVGFNPDHIGDKGPYQQADAGLAQLVASGNGQEAAAIFAKINAQVADAPKYFPAYEEALKGAGDASSTAARKTAVLRAANHQVADSFVNLASAMQKPTLSLDHLLRRWRSQAAAEAQLGKNIATALAKGANPEALSKIIDQLGPQAGLAIKQLAHGGKQDIADLNTAFHTGQRAANVYNGALDTLTKSMLHVPSKVSAQVQVNGVPTALAEMQRLRSLISGHPITQSIIVQKVGQDPRHDVSVGSPSLPNVLLGTGKANGGTIPKDGRSYADRYLYMLAPGEEVISNRHGQADRNRALLKAINANRMASGGTAGRWSGGSREIDYNRLGQAVAKHMPREMKVNGRLDVHQDHGTMRAVARDEINQQSAFDEWVG